MKYALMFVNRVEEFEHLFHATRAELLRALGRSGEAGDADGRALELTDNPAEQSLLRKRSGAR